MFIDEWRLVMRSDQNPIVKAAANFVNWAAHTSPKRKRG
jgi:hypothetical protein